ncbi:hypothetical protein EYZ11_003603 [Aspergillus tanneri]|uniref:Large ribosomal subunit protein bL21m n=1 Tax=Aspergillus tanneri TaxID=1220188 RepID=A0A4S3JMY6_9EURO|nr:uncharacterized protein ATNIH1004_007336 [Aspergillus tanneri]KAA8645915.1 hypothetical protein ATNIH1004_007336 [Aspergillus tanneri]THC96942.1 hypothetical protein EYZ11_003603 [Aspergillus tanneri]
MFSHSALTRAFVGPVGHLRSTTITSQLPTKLNLNLRTITATTNTAANATANIPSTTTTTSPPRTPTTPELFETKKPIPPTFTTPLQVSRSLFEKLPHLTGQRPHYITAHVHDRPYLLTVGDQLRLPFLMPKVKPGDVVRLNRASVLGSREFTMRGAPYLDERLFECRVRVMGTEAEPLRIKEKTKRRQRHVRKVMSKHRYTILKVMDVKVKTTEELLSEGAVVVEDAGLNKDV